MALYCGGKTFNNWKDCLNWIDEINRRERAKPYFFDNAFIGDMAGYTCIISLYLHMEGLWALSINPWTGRRVRIIKPFEGATHTLKMTDDYKSHVPNIRTGDEIFFRQQDTCKIGDFIITWDNGEWVIKQAEKDMKGIAGVIVNVLWSCKGDNSPIIHKTGLNWFGHDEEQMKHINETYKFRCKADIIQWEKEQEEKLKQSEEIHRKELEARNELHREELKQAWKQAEEEGNNYLATIEELKKRLEAEEKKPWYRKLFS